MIPKIWKYIVCFALFLALLPSMKAMAASDIRQVSAGNYHTLVLKMDGTVWSWGANSYGQLGDGTTSTKDTLVQVKGLENVVAIATGDYHSLALKSDNTLWAWGNNLNGKLGDGTQQNRLLPVQVKGPAGTGYLTDVIAVDAGTGHSVALKSDGTVWSWGYNSNGQLGDGTTTDSVYPVQVQDLTGIKQIAAGSFHTIALKDDETIWGWGLNKLGQLGDATITDQLLPVLAKNPADITKPFGGVQSISAAGNHSFAILADGGAWAWGQNQIGQLGIGAKGDSNVPVPVQDPDNSTLQWKGVKELASSPVHTVAIKNDGTLWTWGSNLKGELGIGINGGNKATPVQVVGAKGNGFLTDVVAIAGGFQYTVAVKQDGTIWAWGDNDIAQLGNGTSGTNTGSPTPIQTKKVTLGSLTLSTGTLIPSFSPTIYDYTAAVSGTSTIMLTPTVTDPKGTISASVENGPSVSIPNGTVSAPLALKPGVNKLTILVTAEDGVSQEAYHVTITRDNQLPVATSTFERIANDAILRKTLWVTDPDGDPLLYRIDTNPTNGTVVVKNASTGAYEYTPNPGFTGMDSFTFLANDGTGDSNSGKVTISVKENHPPVVQNPIPNQTITIGETKEIDLGTTFADPDNDWFGLSLLAHEFSYATIQLIDSKLVITGTKAGELDVTVRATDGDNASADAIFRLTVLYPVNQPPKAENTAFTTMRNTPINGKMVASDADQDTLTYSIVTNGTKGTAVITDAENGKFTYTPKSGETGTDEFTFQISDGKDVSNIASVTVRINASVPPPPAYYPVEGIELSRSEWVLKAGEAARRLDASVKPEYATNKQVIWESTDPLVAMVDQNGVVTPLKAGKTTIRVTTVDGNKTAECIVTVHDATVDVTGVELDQNKLTLLAGGDADQLIAKVLPQDASNQKVTWKSSNRKVAKVDKNGVVTPLSVGKTTITVTTQDGKKTDTCLVTVVPKDIIKLEVSETNILVKPNQSVRLKVYAIDKNGKKKDITRSEELKIVNSSDVVTVKGSVIKAGKEEGEATLSVKYRGVKTKVNVLVSTVSVERITPSEKSVTIEPGQTVQLELHARMSDGSDRDVTELAMWSSSKPTYAIIDATGKLTAKKAGKTSIVAKYGGKTVTISVTVKK